MKPIPHSTPKLCPSCLGKGWNYAQIFKDNKSYRLESETCHKCKGDKEIWEYSPQSLLGSAYP